MTKSKQSVHLEIRRGVQTRYLVVLAKNILSPEPGAWITTAEADRLIRKGVDVTVRKEGARP